MTQRPWLRDLITSLIGLWIVAGVYLDGWAHVHVPELESFFTPWHASFYSGLLAFAAWLGVLALKVRQAGDSPLQTLRRLPNGYQGAALGVAIFATGGAVDMFWHELIGIEVSIDALLSPPHLMLLSGVLLMGSTGWRSQRASSPVTTLPELISLTSVVAISGFFLNFLSPFRWVAPMIPFGHDETIVVNWMGGLLVTTALLLIPVLWQIRDGRYRAGTLTTFTAAVGLGVAVAMSEGWEHRILLSGVAGAVAGAALAEFALVQIDWSRWKYGLPAMFGLSAALIWAVQLSGYALAGTIEWPVTLWGGYLLYTAGTGAAVAAVLWGRDAAVLPPGSVVADADVNEPATESV